MTFVFEDIYRNNHFRFNNPERKTTQLPNNTHEDAINYRQIHFQEYTPEYKGPNFTCLFATYEFKSPDKSKTDVYLSYQINPKDSSTLKENFDAGYETGLFFFDKYFNKKLDEKKNFPSLNQNSTVVNSLLIAAPPDTGSLAFEMLRRKDHGVASYHGRFTIKDFNGTDLRMSDIVLASDVEVKKELNGSFRRNNISVLPNPAKSFNKNSPLFLYYEIYNLNKGQNNTTDFEQRITIQEKKDGGIINSLLYAVGIDKSGNKVTLSSNYQTQEEDPQMYLQLDLSKYEPGNYVVTLSVKDEITGNETTEKIEVEWK